MKNIDAQVAREIIRSLKRGTSPIEHVEHLNVGNERWYEVCREYFDDLSVCGDSLVRFIKGYYGDGKTHFLGMLRAIAFEKQWIVSYVTAEKTHLNKFDTVYSEIARNITLPPDMEPLSWVTSRETRGARALLAAVFSTVCREAYPPADRSALNKPHVIDFLRAKSDELAFGETMDASVGKATRGYFDAVIRGDASSVQNVCSWLQGGQVAIPDLGIHRPISPATSRDAMRSLSTLARRTGVGGTLILFDEAERIMSQPKRTRIASYGIIRDLLDNADQQGGMQSSMMYIAATPEMFSAKEGFAENDALRSRLEVSGRFISAEYTDYRSVIVDLTTAPLSHELMVKLAERIRRVHAIARVWKPEEIFKTDTIEGVVRRVQDGVFQVSRPRMLAAAVATILDTVQQNPHADFPQVIDSVLGEVHTSLPKEPITVVW